MTIRNHEDLGFSSRLTNAEKDHYVIRPTLDGYWSGMCPVCHEVVRATDIAVNQLGVYRALQIHERDHTKEATR